MDECLKKLFTEDPAKLEELAVLHWFTKVREVVYDSLECRERPDFILNIGERSIGVEITIAQRNLTGEKFAAIQIEKAQNDFAANLLDKVSPKLPVEIGLVFNREVPVNKDCADKALKVIVPKIDSISESMSEHSVERLVRSLEDGKWEDEPTTHICEEIPDFLQHIQLFNDGHKFTSVAGGGGAFIENFTDEDLLPILESKHKVLKGYVDCDEHWLIVYCGMVPPIWFPEEPPKILMTSVAAAFADLEITKPIESDFDQVFFYKCPSHVHKLTA